jgi:hypothetical protein
MAQTSEVLGIASEGRWQDFRTLELDLKVYIDIDPASKAQR